MTSYLKQPTTSQQQIKQLQEEGLIISDVSKAEKFLENVAYYRLRSYWIIFEASAAPRVFKPGTKFEDITNLYLFDEQLRKLIFSYIAKIEISLRAVFSNLSVDFNSPHFYLDHNNFKRSETHHKSLTKIQKTLDNNKDELFISHYLNKYTTPAYPPAWSIAEVFTMGELQYWITNLNDVKVDTIAKKYGFSNKGVFISLIERLSIIRNVCAHHNRLWNRRIVKKKLKQVQQQNPLKEALAHCSKSDETFYGTFSYLVYALSYIDVRIRDNLIKDFKSLIGVYNVNINEMGFVHDWEKLTLFN